MRQQSCCNDPLTNKHHLVTLIKIHITSSILPCQPRDQTRKHTMILSECHLADLISLYVGIDAMLVMNYSNSPSNDIWGRGHAQHLPPTNCKQNCKSAQDSHQFSSPSQKTVSALQRGALFTTVFPQLLLPQCIHTMFKADSLSAPGAVCISHALCRSGQSDHLLRTGVEPATHSLLAIRANLLSFLK